MSYPKHLFKHPGPYGRAHRSYAVAGAADEAEEAALIARGWHPTLAAALGEPEAKAKRPQLDHDGDGKDGGSTSAAEIAKAEVVELRAEYEKVLGKKPFSGWDAATLREKMKAAADG